MTTSSESTSPSQKEIASQNVPVTFLGAAKVNLEVHDFQDVLAPDLPIKNGERSGTCPPLKDRGTPYKMSMPDKHPQVRIDPKDDKTLKITAPGATLLFTITSKESITAKEYYPVGITFFMVKGKPTHDDKKRLGFLNFTQLKIRPDERSLFITDSYNKENELHERYKFSVIIQRAHDGKIGIIDPFIINEP